MSNPSIYDEMLGILENDTLAQAKKMRDLVGGIIITGDPFVLGQPKNMRSLLGGMSENSLGSIENNALSQAKEMANFGVRENLLFSTENSILAQVNPGSQISLFMEKANKLNILSSSLSNIPFEVEKLFQSQLEFINRSTLSSLLNQYSVDNELYENSIAPQIIALKSIEILHLEYPEADDVDQIDIEELDLGEEEKTAIIKVNNLPLRVLSKILSNPAEVRNITPREFEEFIADLLNELGFKDVVLTPRSRDGGKDIIASHSIQGIPLTFYFECKKYAESNKTQIETMRTLLGTVAHDSQKVNKGVLVTTSTFTKGCKDLILAESRLDGKDYNDILGWVSELKEKI